MAKRLSIPVLLLLSILNPGPLPAAAQALIMRGDSLRAAGQLQPAVEAYSRAFRVDPEQEGLAYSIASTYALQPQFADSAFLYLGLALDAGETMDPLFDPDLYFLVTDERWAAVEDRLLDYLDGQVSGSFDRFYARELLSARMREWAYRYHIMFLYRESAGQSPVLSALANAMQEHHLRNEQDVLELLEERGWPKQSAVGSDAAYAAGNIVTHADLETRRKYLPILRAACEDGEADWSDYAHILDRTELESGRPQVFGTQMELDESRGKFVPRELVDPENVDARRAEKGMEPIQKQLDRFNESMQRDFGEGG